MPAVNKSERNCKPTRRDPEQKLLFVAGAGGRLCQRGRSLLVEIRAVLIATAQGPQSPGALAGTLGNAPMLQSPSGKGQMALVRKKGISGNFCYINLAYEKKNKKQLF